tara:strand:- start:1534 stop:1851 length:318 start_codon:yes stop_codon:yes gene_type:complete
MFTFADNLKIQDMLNILKKVENKTKIQNEIVNNNKLNDELDSSNKPINFPAKGTELLILSEVIIDRKGITKAIEKNSNAPFIINNKIIKNSSFFLFLLNKEIILK